jgi:hypothetical protein
VNRCEDDDAREEQGAEAAETMILDVARLRPAAPSLTLRERIAADLVPPRSTNPNASAQSPRPLSRRLGWLAERMLWAAGGAIAAALPLLLQPRPLPADTNGPALAVDHAETGPPGPPPKTPPAGAPKRFPE